MKWRLRRQENDGGEWSVFDPALDYRICRYNHQHHRGTHLHHPSASRAGPRLEVASAGEADAIMRRYQARHTSFDLAKLKQEIRTWKSESDGT